MAEFDPEAFAAGEPEKPKELPEKGPPTRQTYYYPSTPEDTRAQGLSYAMEGGTQGSGKFRDVYLPDHTFEKYKAGQSDFVAVAKKGEPTGETWKSSIDGVPVVKKWVDTGGGLKAGQEDIATSDPQKAKTGGFDPEAFASGKPEPLPTPSVQVNVEAGEKRPGFDPWAFADLTPEPEPTPAARPQPREVGGGGEEGGAPVPQFVLPQFQTHEIAGATYQPIPFPTPAAQPQPAPTPIGPSPVALDVPLLNPQQLRPVVQAGIRASALVNPSLAVNFEALRRLSPEIADGVEQSAAEQLSSMTTPEGVGMMAPMMIPGVAEGYAVYQAAKTPQHWRGIRNTIKTHGLGSAQSVKALTNEAVRLGTTIAAPAISKMFRPKPEPETARVTEEPPPPPPEVRPPEGVPPEGGESAPQILKRKQIIDRIAAGYDSVRGWARYVAGQKTNDLRSDFGPPGKKGRLWKDPESQVNRDLRAMSLIEEAGYNPIALRKDAQLIKSSKDPKLAAKYGLDADYAIANFSRLTKTPNRHAQLMTDQRVAETVAGIDYVQRRNYVTHALKTEPKDSIMSLFDIGKGGGGVSRYFTKTREFNTLAEAIHAGFDPRSINLADLDNYRIETGLKLILEKQMFNELKGIALPDGMPVVANVKRGQGVPQGYDSIRANGIDIAAHPDISGIFKALYGESALRTGKVGRAVVKGAAVEKSYKLAVDTFHGMRGIMKGIFYGGKGMRGQYNPYITVYEMSDAALAKEVEAGNLSPKEAQWAKEVRPDVEDLIKSGMNVGRYADNLTEQVHIAFPGTAKLNDWIFNRVFRGSMMQAAVANLDRNMRRFPELGREGNLRRTAKEMNEVFGNLGNQGLIKDKTIRDIANVSALAPQWVESQVSAEARGYGQWANVPIDAVTKGKLRVGTVAQGQATAVLAYLLGNQVINYATTGHSTFQNPEGHRLSAYIPVGKGIYLSPLALSAEYVGRLTELMHQHPDENVAQAVSRMFRSKLFYVGAAVFDFASRTSYTGRPLRGSEQITTPLNELVPVPILASPVVRGQGLELDQMTKQLLQSLGMHAQIDYPPQGPVRIPQQRVIGRSGGRVIGKRGTSRR